MPDDAELKRLDEAATPDGDMSTLERHARCALTGDQMWLDYLDDTLRNTDPDELVALFDELRRLLRERDEARADVFLCCQKLGRVRALASAWDGDTTRLRRVEAASRVYRALDEEPGALEALDADQGEGEGA